MYSTNIPTLNKRNKPYIKNLIGYSEGLDHESNSKNKRTLSPKKYNKLFKKYELKIIYSL